MHEYILSVDPVPWNDLISLGFVSSSGKKFILFSFLLFTSIDSFGIAIGGGGGGGGVGWGGGHVFA